MTNMNNIMDCLPYPTVTPIIGQPRYESISEMHLQLNANASSVQYNLGNGTLGNLLLMFTPAVFNTISAMLFVPPPNPGQDPIIPTGSTGPKIVDTHNEHARKTRVYKLFESTDKSIKQLILRAIDDMFVQALRNRHIGYANVTLLQMMAHL